MEGTSTTRLSDVATTRARLLGVGDREPLVSSSTLDGQDDFGPDESLPEHLQRLFCDNVYLTDPWHFDDFLKPISDDEFEPTWRLKGRMKTAGVALVACLNLGTDPPDVVKPVPCARRECWLDPSEPKQKSLEAIGHALQQQYEKWQSKAKYKQCLDPTSEDLRRVCINLRNAARNDRLLLHYNGHGVPRPTRNGELWVLSKHYTHYMPVAVFELRAWLGEPAIYVLDCSGAGALLPHFVEPSKLAASAESAKKLFSAEGTVAADMASAGFYYNEGSSSRGSVYSVLAQAAHLDQSRHLKNKLFTDFYAGMEGQCIVLAACAANEILPLNPQYPADIFTSCLTTPLPIFLRWFILQNPYSMGDISPDLSENIPGKDSDRKTPRGELNWIFTAITDTIAWTTLPNATFQKMFRQDLLVASLFRNFLLAKRIMKSLNCTPQSWPPLPDSSTHPLWQAWDLATESCLSHVVYMQRGSAMVEPKNNMPFYCTCKLCKAHGQQHTQQLLTQQSGSQNSFFADHLTAFEVWLDFSRRSSSEQPTHLPILLQVLLSQTHRLRALQLLRRYLLLGKSAVNLALLVGIFPYILKLLQSPAQDIRQVLVSIWASIIGFDPSCRQELVRDKSQAYFIQYLVAPEANPMQGVTAAFVLAEICNNYRDGQQTCLQQGLHRSCTMILSSRSVDTQGSAQGAASCALLKRWVCLCLFKLCEGVGWAKYVCLMEAGHTQLYALLDDTDPTVRASAVLALGELFGGSERAVEGPAGGGGFMQTEQTEKLKITEQELALQLLENCTDGSVVVRRESLIALCKFLSLPVHNACIQIIAKELWAQDGSACPWSVPAPQAAAVVELVRTRLEEWSATLSRDTDGFPNRMYGSTDSLYAPRAGSFGDGSYMLGSSSGSGTPRSSAKKYDESSSQSSSRSLLVPTESDDVLPPSSPLSSKPTPSPAPSVHAAMATGYLRLWLALYEVQCKDPFPSVAKAAQTITSWVRNCVASAMERERDNKEDGSVGASRSAFGLGLPPLSPFSQRASRMGGPIGGGFSGPGQGPGMAPGSPFGANGTPTSSSGSGPFFSFGSQTNMMAGSLSGTGSFQNMQSLSGSSGNLNILGEAASGFPTGGATGDIPPEDEHSLPPPLSSPHLTSHLYDWLRALFLTPVDINYYEDPLSVEGGNRLYRHQRLEDLLTQDQAIRAQFKDLVGEEEEGLRGGGHGVDKYGSLDREGISSKKSQPSSAASLSPAAYKFEQRSILNIENADMTSLAMFHSFLDILAVSDGYNVGIWNVNTGTKVLSIRPTGPPQTASPSLPIPASPTYNISFSFSPTSGNTFANYIPNVPPPAATGAINSTGGGPGEKTPYGASVNAITSPKGSFTTPSSGPGLSAQRGSQSGSSMAGTGGLGGRITAMTWINESYDALLMLGSDNGTVTVWRDTATSEPTPMQSTQVLDPEVSLASSFLALPDVADTSRGSGMIMSWQQTCGSLTVGGNSGTIRIWDLGREQCVRIFTTGLETCVTAIASRSVTHDSFPSGSGGGSGGSVGSRSSGDNGGGGGLLSSGMPGNRMSLPPSGSAGHGLFSNSGNISGIISPDTVPLTWTFAGFADGSVGVFDERLPGTGRVAVAREHSAWIVSAHLRHDLPEAITGSVRGSVKFWDLRTMRTYKTLEVHKSPLTALAVHNTAPIMATGSHAQFIKILTLGGEQLGGIIKYHDGFLGQRIGPVSCLAFHPIKMMLVAGATDSIVSIYSTTPDV